MALKFNSFDHISKTLDLTKNLLFPFKFKFWFFLAIISIFSYAPGGVSNSGSSFNVLRVIPKNPNVFTTANLSTYLPFLIPIVFLILVLNFVMMYITSTISFVFIECLDKRKITFRKSFSKYQSLGTSLFLFRMVTGIICLILLILIWIPLIVMLLSSGINGISSLLTITTLFTLIPSVILTIMMMFIIGIFMFLFVNFSMNHMYFQRLPAWISTKKTFSRMKNQKLEILLYWISRIVINIVGGFIVLIGLLVILFVMGLIGVPIGIGFYFLIIAVGWNLITGFLATLFITIGIIVFLIALAMVALPITVYGRYFSIRNYFALMKEKK